MNKKLMALAVAGALAAPGLALAQATFSPAGTSPAPFAPTGVQIYGRLDEAIMNQKLSSNGAGTIDGVKKSDLFAAGNAMGVRGREDLGGGTSLWFQLEAGVNPDGRIDNAATTGSAFGGRNSALGVSSSLGDIVLGIWDTPYKVAYVTGNSITSGPFSAYGITMGNGDTTGALNNALCQTTVNNASGSITLAAPATNSCVTEATANGTAWSRRINNSVQYWSPVFGGFQFKLMAALANYQSPGNAAFASGLPKAKEMSANVTWARGPFSIAAGYDAHEGLRPGTAAGQVANPKDDAFNLGAKWNFGLGEVGVGYEKLSYEQNNNSATAANGLDVENMVANGRINVGPGAIWGSYSTAEGKSCTGTTTVGSASCGLKAKMSVLGYDYVMSKRTKMYIAYAKIDNAFANGVGTNYYYIAGPAGNNSNGTASGIQAGTDVTTLAVGIQHLF